jgi:hypothetical protein
MIIFKIFHIKRIIQEARENPSKLAGNEVGDILWDIVLIPIIIGIAGILLFFIVGYTNWFGFHLGIFKFLFWLSLIVGVVIFSVIRQIVKSISKTTTIHTKSVIKTLDLETSKEDSKSTA